MPLKPIGEHLPHFSPLEDYACALASLEASEREQQQTSEVLESATCKFYPNHLNNLCKTQKFDNPKIERGVVSWSQELSAAKRPQQRRLWYRFKHTIKPFYINTLNPILKQLLNKDGSKPSGRTRDDMLKEVLAKLYSQTHEPKTKAGSVDENGVDSNGTRHVAVMPSGWTQVHFYGWSMLGPLSPTMCHSSFVLSAQETSNLSRQPPLHHPLSTTMEQGIGGDGVIASNTFITPSIPPRVVGNGNASRAHQRKIIAQHGSFNRGGVKPLSSSEEAFPPSNVSSQACDDLSSSQRSKVRSTHVEAANILAQAEERKLIVELNAQQRDSRTKRIEELKLLLSILDRDVDADEYLHTKGQLVALLQSDPPPTISIDELRSTHSMGYSTPLTPSSSVASPSCRQSFNGIKSGGKQLRYQLVHFLHVGIDDHGSRER